MTLADYVTRWKASTLSERSGYQQHFLDLCDVLGEPHPAEMDQTGEEYTFEKGVRKTSGGEGWADVWKKGYFGWEYKGKDKNLASAYQQLLQYREDLENPPLLVVCDLNRFQVHTNFTSTAKKVYSFTLDDLLANRPTPECSSPPLEVLRALFGNPGLLRPDFTREEVTERAAREFATLATSLRNRGYDPQRAAHFLMRLLFCLFAEDIGLLPPALFTKLVERTRNRPDDFRSRLAGLFSSMATGGAFGSDDIPYFNGDLFTDAEVLELTTVDLDVLSRVSALDWSSVEPAIFGTLFERSLNPDKRSQLGAHYTSRDDILLVVEPVLMAPLRRRWAQVKAEAEAVAANFATKIAPLKKGSRTATAGQRKRMTKDYQATLRPILLAFVDELSHLRVLDPACGSGNFLYVALKRLLDLWKEVSSFGNSHGLTGLFPYQVNPSQLFGIETNAYAQELASVVVWIGYIQWLRENGFGVPPVPILRRLDNIRRMDAVLDYNADGKPVEPAWPDADVIIGNPPFLGDKKMREGLGDKYVDDLRALYADRVPGGADFVTYWHERARAQIAAGTAKRAGLLATNSIRSGASRRVLDNIQRTGGIFMAWSDRPWVLDGAAVRVSIVGFDDGTDSQRLLDGQSVTNINADLTTGIDVLSAPQLTENSGIAFHPHGRPNSEVIKPWMNASDITRRTRGMHIIDFGEMESNDAALFEEPFEYVNQHIRPIRELNNDPQRRTKWWRLGRSGADLRRAKQNKNRIIVTPRVAKHRLFVWADSELVPDSRLFAFARDDSYFFGVLHSRAHEVWTLATCSWHGVGDDPTYNTSTCFEPFPFPWPPGHEPAGDLSAEAIAAAARDLVAKRDAWLNPPSASESELKKRTLTNLYNQRPTWLDDSHRALDRAVFAAYGWPADISDDEILRRLLDLNHTRAARDQVAAAAK
ncbi:MAG: class I SAM-dependent DNA methyltransferase [Acidobacteriia bacterium]|nr:class I SAM-dependent DNA methyltransferase [Terriglobia bacterium]